MRFLPLLALLFLACTPREQRPVPTIEEKAFAALLTDMRLLEGAYSVHYQQLDRIPGQLAQFYQQVFNKHGVTYADFQQSMLLYSANTDAMMRIEDAVMEELMRRQAEVGDVEEPPVTAPPAATPE